jgi:hypothetical protein
MISPLIGVVALLFSSAALARHEERSSHGQASGSPQQNRKVKCPLGTLAYVAERARLTRAILALTLRARCACPKSLQAILSNRRVRIGGEGGIRTHGGIATTPVFKT